MEDFIWCRSKNGYVWNRRDDGREVLEHDYVLVRPGAVSGDKVRIKLGTPARPGGPLEYGWTTYTPADVTPPLFEQFAALADGGEGGGSLERALAFATQHGHLTLHSQVSTTLRPEEKARIGEGQWQILLLNARSDSPHWGRKWRDLCGVPEGADHYRPVLDHDNQESGRGETWDLWRLNAAEMQRGVDLYKGLDTSADRGRDRAALEWLIGRELDGRVRMAIDWRGDPRRKDATGHLALRPRDLLGFIWLQFARQVTGAEEYRRCPQCGEYFSLLRYGLTANQRAARRRTRKPYAHADYCSEFCRKAHHYQTVTVPARQRARAERANAATEPAGRPRRKK